VCRALDKRRRGREEKRKRERERERVEIIKQRMKNVELTLGAVSMLVDECGRVCAPVCVRARAYVRGRICARVDGFHEGDPAG